MKPNIGKNDRIARIVLAACIAGAGIYFKSWWGLLALVPLVTAFISFCPLYTIIGINSCDTKKLQ